jgi:hypothetical protein
MAVNLHVARTGDHAMLPTCREIEGMSPIPGDMWATREFHIKWRRWSFIHTSWDNLVTLSQLAGYKRVTNYMKRADEAEVRMPQCYICCCGCFS